jgi:dTDP-L-rhamnose 4-epimerase
MRILVTGGAGFIGSHLVDELVARGHSVRILDLLVPQVHGEGSDWPTWVPAGVERIRADVQDREVWPSAVNGVDAVYHFAAEVGVGQSMYEISRYMGANTMGTAHLLEFLAQGKHTVRRLIVASSMSIYGEGLYRTPSGQAVFPGVRTSRTLEARRWDEFGVSGERLMPGPTPEDKPLEPTSIYAISKRDQEEMCLSVGRAYGIPTVALRFFNVYGPRQSLSNPYTGVAAIFAGRILNGKSPVIFEDGAQGRDFVHVSDIVQAVVLALSADAACYEPINVGTGHCTSVLAVAETLIRLLGSPVKPEIVGQYRAGDIRYCYADIGKARRLLGYGPRVTFEAGMRELVGWLATQKAEDRVAVATAELAARGLTR